MKLENLTEILAMTACDSKKSAQELRDAVEITERLYTKVPHETLKEFKEVVEMLLLSFNEFPIIEKAFVKVFADDFLCQIAENGGKADAGIYASYLPTLMMEEEQGRITSSLKTLDELLDIYMQ